MLVDSVNGSCTRKGASGPHKRASVKCRRCETQQSTNGLRTTRVCRECCAAPPPVALGRLHRCIVVDSAPFTFTSQMCKAIPLGKVSTYGDMAKALGSSPRAVGQVSVEMVAITPQLLHVSQSNSTEALTVSLSSCSQSCHLRAGT